MTNKIREYIMVKDKFNHPKLEEVGCYEWHGDLKYTDEIYEMLNHIFKMDRLVTEISYVIAFDHTKKPKGVCRIGQGDANQSPMSMQNIFTFLLLTGANSFIVAHNHISDMPEASDNDKIITMKLNSSAMMFEMEFIGHMIINPCGYIINGGNMNGTAREYDEYGDLVDCELFDTDDEENEDYEPFASNAATIHVTSEDLEEVARLMRKRAESKGGF